MVEFFVQATIRILVEVFAAGFTWILGTIAIKAFTLGRASTGKFRYAEWYKLSGKQVAEFKVRGIDIATEIQLANRTMLIGTIIWVTPIMASLILIVLS